MTYEQVHHPHHIGHRKGWLSQHTSESQSLHYTSHSNSTISRACWIPNITDTTWAGNPDLYGSVSSEFNCSMCHKYLNNNLSLPRPVGNLQGEAGAAERVVEDVFIRRFIYGTFHGCLADEVVIKRRGNILVICAVMIQKLIPSKFYFLIGYTEELLSHFYKCPVKMEMQTVEERVVYKYL